MIALVTPPARSRRTVGLRLLAGPALGQLGPFAIWTLPLVYLVLPLIAAFHLRADGPDEFLAVEVPRLTQGVGWVLAFQAWALGLVDRFPLPDEHAVVRLDVVPRSPPSARWALARLVTGFPVGVALWLAGIAALPLWLVSQAAVLSTGRQPRWLRAPLAALLVANARFLLAHASIAHRRGYAGPALVRASGLRSRPNTPASSS